MRQIAITIAAGLALAACQLPYTGGARPIAPAQLDASWLRAAPTPVVVQQHETDCGLAALAMVAGAWGRDWTVGELANRLHPDHDGVTLGALRDFARARGLDAYAISATPHDLAHELAAGRPVMLGLVLPFDQHHNRSHYEVAVAMDPHDGTVVTIDPADGSWKRRSKAVLDAEWHAAGHAALVVVGGRATAPKPNVKPGPSP